MSFKWIEGRQGSGYFKMPLWISEFFKCDLYLLKIPEGVSVPTHKDPVKPGYNHHRINFVFEGRNFVGDRMYVLGKCRRWWRFTLFRPDLVEHGMLKAKREIKILSFGWLTKQAS